MILLITGNGKGKTTSALGTAVRACGWEKKVAIVFFDKGGSHYGEGNILDFLQEKKSTPDVFRFGCERFDPVQKTFRFENTDQDKLEAEHALEKIRALYKEDYFLIVADEIVNAMNLGLIDGASVRDLVTTCPSATHLILTGRNAPEWLIERADLVSEVKEVKHYFKKGVDAVEGLDY